MAGFGRAARQKIQGIFLVDRVTDGVRHRRIARAACLAGGDFGRTFDLPTWSPRSRTTSRLVASDLTDESGLTHHGL